MSVNDKMTAIADSIRSCTKRTVPLTLDDMAIAINEVYETAYNEGGEEGYNSGVEEGKNIECDEFWRSFVKDGNSGVYYYTFSENRWNKYTFKPTCNIVLAEADHAFYRHNYGNTSYDLAQHLEDRGALLDFSNCTLGNYTFDSARITRLPELNMSKGTFTCFVRNCINLETIDKLIVSDAGDQNFTQTFNNCNTLKNITFEGVIGRSIGFPVSPLSAESLKSIITHLKDYTGEDEYTYTVTFKTSAFEVLESEGATAEYNGTACTWAELIDNKKWNLVKG